MSFYKPPFRDMSFVLHELLGSDSVLASGHRDGNWDRETINQTLEAMADFAGRELVPINASGDVEGCKIVDGRVKTPAGFARAYHRYVEAGWPTLSCAEEFGGQNAPSQVFSAATELLYAANPGWAMYPGTANGAYKCLLAHASSQQQDKYLLKIVSGEWTTTMCLTEPHCGSDLSLLGCKAITQPDGSYRITGSKIFISGGDHDLAENIVHLVLARLPDAPAGIGGISLFLVPRHLPEGSGLAVGKNNIEITAVEHKMGLRGSATCAMVFDDAVGWLVGQANEGLRNMFVMINSQRLLVSTQAVGMGHAAYVSSLSYARERLQMRAASGVRRPELPADPIIEHADVRRMLLTQKAYVEASRMLVYWLSALLDNEKIIGNTETRKELSGLIGLLTPVAKTFLSENASIVANLAIQIHGGHGYVCDYGVEQIVRDVRIAQIYEGTSGIQARDLLTRKVLGDGGASLNQFLERISNDMNGGIQHLPAGLAPSLNTVCDQLQKLTVQIEENVKTDADEIGAAGCDYLRALGHITCAWLFAHAAGLAQKRILEGSADPYYPAKLDTARYYFARLLPEALMHIQVARSGLSSLGTLSEDRMFI